MIFSKKYPALGQEGQEGMGSDMELSLGDAAHCRAEGTSQSCALCPPAWLPAANRERPQGSWEIAVVFVHTS